MALLDREDRDGTGEIDRRLLVVALALALLTALAVVDAHRPVPGSELPVEVRIPVLDLPPVAMPSKPMPRRIDPDDLLAHD